MVVHMYWLITQTTWQAQYSIKYPGICFYFQVKVFHNFPCLPQSMIIIIWKIINDHKRLVSLGLSWLLSQVWQTREFTIQVSLTLLLKCGTPNVITRPQNDFCLEVFMGSSEQIFKASLICYSMTTKLSSRLLLADVTCMTCGFGWILPLKTWKFVRYASSKPALPSVSLESRARWHSSLPGVTQAKACSLGEDCQLWWRKNHSWAEPVAQW